MNDPWIETPRGGLTQKTDDGWLARPFNKVGMSTIKHFPYYTDAFIYAETEHKGA